MQNVVLTLNSQHRLYNKYYVSIRLSCAYTRITGMVSLLGERALLSKEAHTGGSLHKLIIMQLRFILVI